MTRLQRNRRLRRAAQLVPLVLLGCSRADDGTMRLTDHAAPMPAAPAEEPPVATNPVSPVRYPPALLQQGIEGRVLLRLYVDAAGTVIPDSTRVAESSGYPALDSAALAGAPALHFSPALRQGQPVSALFLQPVQFRSNRSRSTAE
jgi:periplasmic protein TonB